MNLRKNLRQKAQAKMQTSSKDETEEKQEKKTTVDVDKKKTEKVSKKTNKDDDTSKKTKTKKTNKDDKVDAKEEKKKVKSKKVVEKVVETESEEEEKEEKKKVKRNKKVDETDSEKKTKTGEKKKKRSKETETESSDESEKEVKEKKTRSKKDKEGKRSKKDKESEESGKEEEEIKVFDRERNIDNYKTSTLRKFASKVKMEGRTKLNKEKLYDGLMKIDYVIDLDSEEKEMDEFDKNKEIEFYTTNQLKLFAKNIYLQGRAELKSKQELYNALKKYYEDELYLNPSMAPKNLKEFTTNFTVDQYTRSQLYELGKSKKLKVRRDMNKDTLYEFLSNPDKQLQNDENIDVFQLMTKYKVTKTYNVDNNRSKLLHLTSGKKDIYVLFSVGELGVDCKSLSKEDFDIMIQ